MNKLAILGGKKSITIKSPHWKWPPSSKEKIEAVNRYYRKEENHFINGVPLVVKRFEQNFAKFQKRKYALALNSGTSTLLAAFFAIGIKPGDEVIAPTLTFHATATPLGILGAIPVLADCEKETGNISPEDIKKKITKKTKAVVINHLCGHPCEMTKILKIVKSKKIFLIEDCSHAHGSTYKGKKVGNFSDIACFSLDRNKMISAGEGGVLVTNSKLYYERALILSDFGPRIFNEISDKFLKKFNETGLGYKHRIHPVAAVIANSELKNLNKYILKRKTVLNHLSNKIKKIPGMSPPITKKYVTRGAFYGYRPFINLKELNNIKLAKFIKILKSEGMEVRQSGNPPLHTLNFFKNSFRSKILNKPKNNPRNTKNLNCPNSKIFYENTISIPTFTFEKKKLINQYISAFKKVCFYLKYKKL